MNVGNKRIVRDAIDEAAQYLKGKLPPSKRHPAGRNPHAHIAQVLKSLLGRSYTECKDDDITSLLALIKEIRDNPF